MSTKRNPSNTVAVSEDTGGKTLPFKGPLPAFSCGETAPGSLFGGGAKARSRDQEIDWHKNGQLRWWISTTHKKKRNSPKAGNKMKFVSFFSSKKWCVGWYCWLFLKIWCSFYFSCLFFGTVHAHLWKKLGRIYPYNFKLIRSLHLEGCFCSSAANGCSAKKTGGISLQLCPENCQKLTAAAGAQPFLPAFSRCFVHLSMFHHLFRSGRQHKDISKWTAETLPIPSSIQNRTVLKKPGTVQFILTQLLTRLVFTTHPGNFGFETNPGAHGGSPSKRPEQEGKKMPGPSMYIDIYIFTYKLVGDWLRYMQT